MAETQVVDLGAKVAAAVQTVPMTANGIVIQTSDDYTEASRFVIDVIRPLVEQVRALFEPHKKRAFDAHRALCGDEKARLAPLLAAEKLIDEKMRAWAKAERERAAKVEEKRSKKTGTPVHVAPNVPVVDGQVTREAWRFTVTNRDLVTPAFLVPDEVKIRKAVNAMGKDAEKVVGGIAVEAVEVYARRKS